MRLARLKQVYSHPIPSPGVSYRHQYSVKSRYYGVILSTAPKPGRAQGRPAACKQQTSCLTRLKAMGEQQYQVLEPVQATKTGLTLYSGDSILTDCFKTASVTEKDADGIVLGVATTAAPLAIQDFSLGKVCHCNVLCTMLFLRLSSALNVGNVLQLHCSNFVSSARNKIWWMTPHWGAQACDILPGVPNLYLIAGFCRIVSTQPMSALCYIVMRITCCLQSGIMGKTLPSRMPVQHAYALMAH